MLFFYPDSYDKKLAQSDLNQISDREVVTRTASKDETLVIKDEKSKTPWELQIKTVEMPESSGVSDDVPIESGPCGCAKCNNLSVCPSSCQCLDTTCGAVCCVPTSGCPGKAN